MKRLVMLFVVLAVACGKPPSGAEPTITLEPGTSTLAVDLEGLRNEKGTMYCSLFNAPEGFPGPSPIVNGARELQPSQKPLHVSWENLPAGKYAVTCQHDEDDDGTLDANFLGIPTEGYGVTNNIYPSNRAPSFDEAKVDLTDAQQASFTITLKY